MVDLNIAIVGGGGVGKSCITVQFVSHVWDHTEGYDPTIEDTFRKTIQVDNTVVHLTVLDTAGQDEFAALVKDSMEKADGIILVYDLTSVGSFQKLNDFVKLLFRVKEDDLVALGADAKTKSKIQMLPILLVGNKLDLAKEGSSRKITPQMAQEFALNILTVHDMKFPPEEPPLDPKTKKPLPIPTFPILDASAKTRTNIDQLFEEAVRQTLKWKKYLQDLHEAAAQQPETLTPSPSAGPSAFAADPKKDKEKDKKKRGGLLSIFKPKKKE